MMRSTPGRLLERADVASLAADDAALHLLVRQRDDGDRRLRGVVGGDALHDGGQDPSRAVLALLGRVALDVADAVLRLGLRLVHDLADQSLARLGRAQAGDALQLAELALLELARGAAARRRAPAGAGEGLLALLERGHLAIERLLPVQESALGALLGGPLLAPLLLGGAAQVEGLVLALEDDLLLLGARLGHEALGVVLGVLDGARAQEAAREESDHDAGDRGDRRHEDDEGIRHFGSPETLEPAMGDVAPAMVAGASASRCVRGSGRFPIGGV